MSDTPQGPGWWQASDDKWYPPPRPEMPGETPGTYPSEPPTAPVGPGGPPLGSGPGIPGAAPSPYGGVPPMGAPPGQQNRTPLFVALGVLGVAAVILLIVLVASGGDDDDGPTAGATTTQDQPATTDDTDITLPDDGGGNGGGPVTEGDLAVAESGFSEYKESFSNDKFTAYGAVIQNNGDQVARNVDVEIGFLDASGTVLATDTKYITVLKPGQKFGVGGTSVDATGVTELSVTASASDSDDPADYGDLTVEGVSVEFDSDGAPTANFTVKSTYTDKLDGPNLYAIFRDGSGKIVGGDYDFMDFIPAGADAVGSVTSFAPIANIDGTKTEIYVDPNIF